MIGGHLQSNDISPTLKPSFCKQRANRRAPSFASSSLSSMGRGRRALALARSPSPPASPGWCAQVCHVYLVAPVQMIFPEDHMEAVILGLRSFIRTFCKQGQKTCSQVGRVRVRACVFSACQHQAVASPLPPACR